MRDLPGSPPGDLASALDNPAAVPPRTPENMVCLRGPCRHYWTLTTMAHAGNPASYWESLGREAPRQRHHVCTFNKASEMEIGDDNVFECSAWDPLDHHELVKLRVRREAYEEKALRESEALADDALSQEGDQEDGSDEQ